MKISIDFEDEIRKILAGYVKAYCKPLPKDFETPSILITQVGGRTNYTWAGVGMLDDVDITLDSRAKTDAEAVETLRKAVGYLEGQISTQTTPLLMMELNTMSSSITDPARPDLKMCTARILTRARRIELQQEV